MTDFWTHYNVTSHHRFTSRADSLEYLNWRNWQYQFYEQLMPCDGHDGKVVVDYGCGPGHDLVGFVERSRPAQVIGMEVSVSSLEEARKRLSFHDSSRVRLELIKENNKRLPLEDASVDYFHSSGVLHHVVDIESALREIARVLKPDGRARLMLYNHESVFLHLHVAYNLRILKQIDSDVDLLEAFKRNTDGRDCPISRCYRKDDFLEIVPRCGLDGVYCGAAISMLELSLLPLRPQAILDRALPAEHRAFLKDLTFDEYGRPLYRGAVAGIDGVFELKRRQ